MFDPSLTDEVLNYYVRCVPKQTLATDCFAQGVWSQRKGSALRSRYIQLNAAMIWCLVFDCDHNGAYSAAEDGILPPPNVKVLNPDNGRGHLHYFLAAPVARTDAARIRPLRYLAKIERGMTVRLDADPHYVGLITKNPLHLHWRAKVVHGHKYQLGELHDWLHEANCVAPPKQELCGLGRNCDLFDNLRLAAYRQVRSYRTAGKSKADFAQWAVTHGEMLNCQFPTPLRFSEVRAIARSVTRWTWSHFDECTFREIQSRRGKRGSEVRWRDHKSREADAPWKKEGISRATWYRRNSPQS